MLLLASLLPGVQVFEQLLRRRVTFNSYTYHCLMQLCGSAGSLEDALAVYNLQVRITGGDTRPAAAGAGAVTPEQVVLLAPQQHETDAGAARTWLLPVAAALGAVHDKSHSVHMKRRPAHSNTPRPLLPACLATCSVLRRSRATSPTLAPTWPW